MGGVLRARMRWTGHALALALTLAAGTLSAQIPGLPAPPKEAPKGTPPAASPTPAQTREATVARLKRQNAEIAADRARVDAPPSGIQPDEVADLVDARTALVNANEVQLRSLDELDRARGVREAAEALARNWRGFDEAAPYSILLVDELRETADGVRSRIAAIERSLAHLRSESERYVAETRRAEETLRRAQETLERADDAVERERATWRRDLAQMRLRSIASRAAVAQLLQQVQAEELGSRQADAELLRRKVEVASRGATFGEADLARAKERLAAIHARVRAEQKAVLAQMPAREKERSAAELALAQLRERPDAPRDDLAVAQARLRAADTWLNTLRSERELLEAFASLNEEQQRNWEARRTALTAPDADARFAAAERLRAAASQLARWRGYIESLLSTQRARLADAEAAAVRTEAPPAAVRHDQEAIVAQRRLVNLFERGQELLGGVLRTLDRWVADIDVQHGSQGFLQRLADRWSQAKAWVRDLWNFEVFAVEDTTLVDGHEVKTTRGVTIGKSIGAVLVFIVGYWLASLVVRRVERVLVARGFDARRARNTRRWALAAVAALLALFTLNVARIPLTVFAFLGGALAIGVGFGTQTIIRNFISGLIVLAERRIQIGDIIEVDGVTGTVTAVDLRSSTVLGFDGVETSIPNSVLLEKNVTNWTQTDKRVRRVVKVGVAYGSPLREVSDLLLECAKRHGLVLADPAPQVVFEDFAADALAFSLFFWVELKPGISAGEVGSDLRYMIAKRFAEAGIAIPYAQRDVHLTAPLRIELAGPAGSAPAGGTSGA